MNQIAYTTIPGGMIRCWPNPMMAASTASVNNVSGGWDLDLLIVAEELLSILFVPILSEDGLESAKSWIGLLLLVLEARFELQLRIFVWSGRWSKKVNYDYMILRIALASKPNSRNENNQTLKIQTLFTWLLFSSVIMTLFLMCLSLFNATSICIYKCLK